MFCPICGNDCEEYRFCSRCGTQLKDYTMTGAQDRVYQSEPIAEKQPEVNEAEETAIEIPHGVYEGFKCSLTLYESECVISNRNFLFKKHETRIPYDKIRVVKYVRTATGLSYLLFRWEGNENLPIPGINELRKDPTTISVVPISYTLHYDKDPKKMVKGVNGDTLYYHIFYALKLITSNTARFQKEIQAINNLKEVQTLAAKTNTAFYYEKYAPFRDMAVEEMCRRTGAVQEIVTELINDLFDKQQEEIYATNPMAAVRDLNLIVAEKKRRKEKADEIIEKEYERNRLLIALGNRQKD